jgi:hypothetical protein
MAVVCGALLLAAGSMLADVTGDRLNIGTANDLASGQYNSIAGGGNNTNTEDYSVIGGGYYNTITNAAYSFIGGGTNNVVNTTIYGGGAFIGGGLNNQATGFETVVAGGGDNLAGNYAYAAVCGGRNNTSDNESAFVGGGENNSAGGYGSAVLGGSGNSCGEPLSVVGGGGGNCAGNQCAAVLGGTGNVATGAGSFIGGGENNTNGGWNAVISGGYNNYVDNDRSTIPGGAEAKTRCAYQLAYAGGCFSTLGDAQSSIYPVRNSTTNNTQTELFLQYDGGHRITIPDNSAWTFEIMVVGKNTTSACGFKFSGVIKRVSGTTSIVGSTTKTVIARDNASWDADVVADDTNDALVVKVTGDNSTIRWIAEVRTVELN